MGFKYVGEGLLEKHNKEVNEQLQKIYELVKNGASGIDVAEVANKYIIDWAYKANACMYRLSRRGTGRRPNYDLIRKIRAKRADGMTIRDIATELRCSSATVTKYCRCDDQGNYTILSDVLPR